MLAINPSHSSGKVSWSGSSCVFRSMPARAIRKQLSTIAPNPCQPKPNRQTDTTTSSIVSSSTNGYCSEIGAWQLRQRPRRMSQLSTGMFSHHDNWCLQCGQCERSTTMPGGGGSYSSGSPSTSRLSRFHSHSSRFGRRRITTFRKLPSSNPNPAAAGKPRPGVWSRNDMRRLNQIAAASLKIGRYMPTTMLPTTPPIMIMIIGSSRLDNASTELLTSSS